MDPKEVSKGMKVLNIGSMNLDYVYNVDHIIKPGETQATTGMNIFLGGKGMNQKEFNEVIIRQTDRCKSMLVAKGAEYAPRAVKNTAVDRLAHFKKAAVVLNTTPRAALMGMLSKHLISVSDMCMGEQQYSKEQWDEKITDSINYFLILCAIVEEELNEEN